MWGWVLAAVLWVMGAPWFWNAVKDDDDRWRWKLLALLVWPFVSLAAHAAYAWERIFPRPPRPGRHRPSTSGCDLCDEGHVPFTTRGVEKFHHLPDDQLIRCTG